MFSRLRRGEATCDREAAKSDRVRRYLVLLAFTAVAGLANCDAKAAEVSFDLSVANGRIPESMRVIRVTEGDVVRLRWRVDRPIVLHLHGYDIERRVEPGSVAEMTFNARATGRFPLHAHLPGHDAAGRVHDEIPLLYVEVYPR